MSGTPNPLVLYTLPDGDPSPVSYTPQDTLVLYFFKDPETADAFGETADRGLRNYCRSPVALYTVYVGSRTEGLGRSSTEETVRWAGEDGQACTDCAVTDIPTLLVVRAGEVLYKGAAAPEDWAQLLLSKPQYPEFNYLSFAEYIRGPTATPVDFSYRLLKKLHKKVSSADVETLLSNLSEEVDLDLTSCSDWFRDSSRPKDPYNYIDPSDIDIDQMKARLTSICKHLTQKAVEMENGYPASGKLTVYSLTTAQEVVLKLPERTISFCYFFTESDMEQLATLQMMVKEQLATYCRHPLNVFYLYAGGNTAAEALNALKGKEWSHTVWWLGPKGLQSDEWRPFEVASLPSLLVLNGVSICLRLSALYPDLSVLLPPVPISKSLDGLSQLITPSDNYYVRNVYKRALQTYGEVGGQVVDQMVASLAEAYNVDLPQLQDWLREERCKFDESDRIADPNSLLQSEFELRVANFCRWTQQANQPLSLQLLSLRDGTPFQRYLTRDQTTLLFFFTKVMEAEAVHSLASKQIGGYCLSPLAVYLVYCGQDPSAQELQPLKEFRYSNTAYWVGPAGTQEQLCVDYKVAELPVMLALTGGAPSGRYRGVPTDLSEFLPPAATYQPQTYYSLYQQLQYQYDPGPLQFGYSRLLQTYPTFTPYAASVLISSLSQAYSLNLRELMQWIQYQDYAEVEGYGGSTITLQNITLEEFKARLLSFLNWKSMNDADPAAYKELRSISEKVASVGKWVIGLLGLKGDTDTASKQKDAELVELHSQLQMRQDEVEQLKRELADRNSELSRLKEVSIAPSYLDVESVPAAKAISIVEKTEAKEVDFWKVGQEEDWESVQRQPQRFEEIAAAKGLWIVSAENKGSILDAPDLGSQMLAKNAPRPRKKGALPPLQEPPRPPQPPKEPKPTLPNPKAPPKASLTQSGSIKQIENRKKQGKKGSA